MRYQHLKTTRKILHFLVPALPFIVALSFFSYGAEIPQVVRNAAHALASPFWSYKQSISATVFPGSEIDAYMQSLHREKYIIDSLKEDNDRLRALLDRNDDDIFMLSAAVIHHPSFSPYDTFIIDQGGRDGIREGMLVVTPEQIAVGFVVSAHERTATVSLFSAPERSMDALLRGGTTTIHARLDGYGGGTMKMTVPRDVITEPGMHITLPSFDTYVIGTVSWIEVSPENAYKVLYIKPPENMHELRYVLVDTTSVWRATPNAEAAQDTE